MVSFSKPIRSSPEETLPAKRKRTLNSKLTSEDNVHQDVVKRRKLELHTTQQKNSTSKNLFHPSTQNPKPSVATSKQHSSSRQVSVEEVDDDVNESDGTSARATSTYASPPKKPNVLEQIDDSDDGIEYIGVVGTRLGGASQDPIQPFLDNDANGEDELELEEDELQEETDEQELGKLYMFSITYSS